MLMLSCRLLTSRLTASRRREAPPPVLHILKVWWDRTQRKLNTMSYSQYTMLYYVILVQLNFLSKNIKMSQKPKCYIILETNFLAAFLRYKVMIIEEFTIYNDVIAGCAWPLIPKLSRIWSTSKVWLIFCPQKYHRFSGMKMSSLQW